MSGEGPTQKSKYFGNYLTDRAEIFFGYTRGVVASRGTIVASRRAVVAPWRAIVTPRKGKIS